MSQHVFSQLATKTDLDHAVVELKSESARAVSELTLRLVVAAIAVAGLALAIAKLP